MTSKVLRAYDGEPAKEAEVHSIEGVVEAVVNQFKIQS